jgi:DNA (cytosine-5)-methyltransferase 1
MSDLRIGSLFSGYGGLTLAVQAAIGGTVAWHSEIEDAPSQVLAARFPGVPDLGDITQVDWSTVEPVDILEGGFPCTDVSLAGRRRGLGPGTRTGLWSRMADAIDHLRPSLVVAENVRGLLSAEAHSDVEPCPWCLGDSGDAEPPLRALGAVLADLADLGYDAGWYGLRASDVGAPHGRFRVFIVSWPAADTDGIRQARAGSAREWRGGPADDGLAPASDPDRTRREGRDVTSGAGAVGRPGSDSSGLRSPDGCHAPAADAKGDGRHEGRPEPAGLVGRPDAALGGAVAPDAGSDGRGRDTERDERTPPGIGTPLGDDTAGRVLAWGAYAPAVARWERVLGRPAPSPTESGSKGQPRLSPVFVEWLMGLPAGWVTATPGISRNDQLKMLGNGVVPQQGAAALRYLLSVSGRSV